jgi:hypothetical protein
MRLTLPPERYEGDAVTIFFDQLIAGVQRLPGIRSVAAASQLPPDGFWYSPIEVEGSPAPSQGTLPRADATIVTENYFDTLGVRVLQGRGLSALDSPDGPPVAVVNETFAARYARGRPAAGQRIREHREGRPRQWLEIVGVVADTRNRGLHRPVEPEVFISTSQARGAWNQLFLVVRTAGDPEQAVPAVSGAGRGHQPQKPR